MTLIPPNIKSWIQSKFCTSREVLKFETKQRSCLFTDSSILYKDLKASTIILKLINEFSKVTGYNNSVQKSIVFLYTHNEYKIKKIPFTTISIRIKFLGIKTVENEYF